MRKFKMTKEKLDKEIQAYRDLEKKIDILLEKIRIRKSKEFECQKSY